jgi:hypothetical protein
MKRLLALLAGGLGLGALLHRRGRASSPAPASSPADDLRAKLDASKGPGAGPVDAPRPEQQQPEESPATPDVDTRRADVHARARQAIDDLGETTKTERA